MQKPSLVIACAVVGVLTSAASTSAAPARPQVDRPLALLVARDINAYRSANGLPALRQDPALDAAARTHSTEMAARGYFSHDSADGRSFVQRIRLYLRRGGAGENLFWESGAPSAEDILAAWAASPEHRANLLGAGWRALGVSAVHAQSPGGAFGDGDVLIVTADFAATRS